VLFATPGKDRSTWEKLVEALGAHNSHPRAITEVSIDMRPAYIAGVNENLGDQAGKNFDKFHVIMHATISADETRRVEKRLANKPDRERLKESRWGLLKNPVHHTTNQALKNAGLLKTNLTRVKGQQMRLIFQKLIPYRMQRWRVGNYALGAVGYVGA
jgi:transposase